MHRSRLPAAALVILLLLLGACTPGRTTDSPASTSGGQSNGPAAASDARPAAPKVLRIALSREPDGFVISLAPTNSTSGGATQAQNIPANKLQNTDERGQAYAEL